MLKKPAFLVKTHSEILIFISSMNTFSEAAVRICPSNRFSEKFRYVLN